jgi:uncharacterized protein GlcG (DUF336 family)
MSTKFAAHGVSTPIDGAQAAASTLCFRNRLKNLISEPISSPSSGLLPRLAAGRLRGFQALIPFCLVEQREGGTNVQTGGRATILLEEAQAVIQAAMEKAREIGQPMNVAVVDNGRDLKAFSRMEDAWLGSIDIAINKAFTSASFLISTQDLAGMTQPGQPLYGLETTNNGRVVNFAGGIPLMRDGEVAGAIGVSGGTVDQDQEVAEAGVAAF